MTPLAPQKAFLQTSLWQNAHMTPLAQDASARRYFLCQTPDQPNCLLMDACDLPDSIPSFYQIGIWLRTLSHTLKKTAFYIPEILHHQSGAPFLLVENLGKNSFTTCLDSASVPQTHHLYQLALQAILSLQAHAVPSKFSPALIPTYTLDRLLEEVSRFDRFYLPFHTNQSDLGSVCPKGQHIWQKLLTPLTQCAQRFVHLDFHMDNLFLVTHNAHDTCALIDFQDARWGHPLYDIMSLLWDARRDVPDTIQQACFQDFLKQHPDLGLTSTEIDSHLPLLIVQRSLKILGIFAKQAHFNGRTDYLVHLPRLWRLIQQNITHPSLSELKHWLDQTVSNQLPPNFHT